MSDPVDASTYCGPVLVAGHHPKSAEAIAALNDAKELERTCRSKGRGWFSLLPESMSVASQRNRFYRNAYNEVSTSVVELERCNSDPDCKRVTDFYYSLRSRLAAEALHETYNDVE